MGYGGVATTLVLGFRLSTSFPRESLKIFQLNFNFLAKAIQTP